MHIAPLCISSNLRSYQVSFEPTAQFFQQLAQVNPAVFVVDAQVWNLYKDTALACLPQERLVLFDAVEENKNLASCCTLYEKIMAFAPRKNLTLISIGGGITQDVTGFVASTLYRGINWIFVPTTLLAQVDSCIGAKTSLNFKSYKNLLGSFYPPSAIYLWSHFVQTLTETDFFSGVGEMAKLHIMAGEDYIKDFLQDLPAIQARKPEVLLAKNAICLQIKKEYIENDEFDTGKRNLLNYGHCFGHAIESACNFAIPHGQAVVLGMLLANKYAADNGFLSAEKELFLRKNILLPIFTCRQQLCAVDAQQALSAMGQDKKRTGNGLALVMLTDQGMKKITDLQAPAALALLQSLEEICHD